MDKKFITINDFMFFLIFIIISILGNEQVLNSLVLPQIKSGIWMIENHELLNKDIFSYTMKNNEWINVNWLIQLIYGFMYKCFGFRGIVTFTGITIALTFSLIFSYLGKMKSNIYFSMFFVLIGGYVSIVQWLALPFTMNLLFCVVFFSILDDYYKNGGKKIYFLIILQILWQNINSEYIYGYLIVGIYILGIFLNKILKIEENSRENKESIKKIIIIFILIILVVPINPFGIKLIKETFRWYTEVFRYRLGDWRSPNFHEFAIMVNYFFIGYLVVIFFLKKRILRYEYILTILFWQFMFLFAQRNIAIYIIFILLCVPNMIELESLKKGIIEKLIKKIEKNSNEFLEEKKYKLNWIFILFVIVFSFLLNGNIEKKYPTNLWDVPLKPIKYMKENNIKGKGINTDMYGNFIIWELYPEVEVFIDNRSNFYSIEQMDDYGKIYQLNKGWEETIEKYSPKWFIERSFVPTARIINLMKDKWVKIYDDGYTSIFLEKNYYEDIKEEIKIEIVNLNSESNF